MTTDVERVARLLAESEGHTWHPWFADQYGEDYRKQARAAMAATREIDAEALRAMYETADVERVARPMANDETLAALERATWRCAHGDSVQDRDDYRTIRVHIETLRNGGDRAQIVAWLRSKEAARIACSHYAYMNDLADAIEAGEHVGGE